MPVAPMRPLQVGKERRREMVAEASES